MTHPVLCLRPEADFAASTRCRHDAYGRYTEARRCRRVRAECRAHALVIPAVGPKLPPSLFEGTSLKLVQVTGAGLDRLDQAALTRLGIPVANVRAAAMARSRNMP